VDRDAHGREKPCPNEPEQRLTWSQGLGLSLMLWNTSHTNARSFEYFLVEYPVILLGIGLRLFDKKNWFKRTRTRKVRCRDHLYVWIHKSYIKCVARI